MLNWKVRIKNKAFWLTFIPTVIILIQSIATTFGITLDLGEVGNNLITVVNSLFAVLVIVGVVNDPTTAGLVDSEQALTYDKPKE